MNALRRSVASSQLSACIRQCPDSGESEASARTERDLGEEVVYDVIVRDIMHEEPPDPPQEVAVHRRRRAAAERPRLAAVVREARVRVLEVRDADEPVAEEDPRDAVQLHDGGDAQLRGRLAEHEGGGEDADVGEDHGAALARFEDGAVRCADTMSFSIAWGKKGRLRLKWLVSPGQFFCPDVFTTAKRHF